MNSGAVGNVYGIVNGNADGTSVQDIVINVSGGSVSSIRGGNSSAGKIPAEFSAQNVSISLTGGEVNGKIYGGSQLTAQTIAIVVDGATTSDIYAGSKYAAVTMATIEVKSGSVGTLYGGGAGGAYDADGSYGISSVSNSGITVSGGTVSGSIYGGGIEGDDTGYASVTVTGGAVSGSIYGGGAADTFTENTEISVLGGSVAGAIYGGGNGGTVGDTHVTVGDAEVVDGVLGGTLNGDAGNTVVEIDGLIRLQPVDGTQADKIQIVGGGMAEAGQSSTTVSTRVTVTDSKIYGDVVAGASATGTGAVATSGKSVVNVNNLEINGYTEGSNIWTGRVFGAGRAQYGGTVYTESTDVTIDNMSGYTYNSAGEIVTEGNKGARVYGAGQAYASQAKVSVGERCRRRRPRAKTSCICITTQAPENTRSMPLWIRPLSAWMMTAEAFPM